MKRLNEQLTPSADLCSVAAKVRRERLLEDDRALKTDEEWGGERPPLVSTRAETRWSRPWPE